MTQQPTQQLPKRPIYSWINGVVYVTGYRQDIPWNGESAKTTLGEFLHNLGRIIEQHTGVHNFDIDAPEDPTKTGMITITIRHKPRPYGQRARGHRGSGRSQVDPPPAPLSEPIPT